METPITALYAGLFGIKLIVLSARISLGRMRYRVGIGSGGERRLERMIRVQGNFVEYIPVALLLLLLNELNHASAFFLHAIGIALLAGRLLHAVGLSQYAGRSFARWTGTGLTWIPILILSGNLLYLSFASF